MMKATAAYDLSAFSYESAPRPRVRVAQPVNKEKKAVKAFVRRFVMLSVALVVLLVATVYSRMVLTETTAMITSRQDTLTELQSENAFLSYQLESLVSLKNAEAYATNELGLVKMGSGQVEYVNLQNTNAIVAEGGSVATAGTFSGLLDGVIEFFGG